MCKEYIGSDFALEKEEKSQWKLSFFGNLMRVSISSLSDNSEDDRLKRCTFSRSIVLVLCELETLVVSQLFCAYKAKKFVVLVVKGSL